METLFKLILAIGFFVSSPLGLWVAIDEFGRSTLETFINIIVLFVPFGGLINWLFFY